MVKHRSSRNSKSMGMDKRKMVGIAAIVLALVAIAVLVWKYGPWKSTTTTSTSTTGVAGGGSGTTSTTTSTSPPPEGCSYVGKTLVCVNKPVKIVSDGKVLVPGPTGQAQMADSGDSTMLFMEYYPGTYYLKHPGTNSVLVVDDVDPGRGYLGERYIFKSASDVDFPDNLPDYATGTPKQRPIEIDIKSKGPSVELGITGTPGDFGYESGNGYPAPITMVRSDGSYGVSKVFDIVSV